MAHNEQSSPRLASLAARAMRAPASLSEADIRALAASVLTQAPDRVHEHAEVVEEQMPLPFETDEPSEETL